VALRYRRLDEKRAQPDARANGPERPWLILNVRQKMKRSREELLSLALQVPAQEVRWYFLSDYYDGPIAGLAIFRGQTFRFCCFQEDIPHQRVYVLQALTDAELADEKRVKSKFERMVGTHGCFDDRGELLPAFAADEALRSQFFAEEPPHETPQPYDRPVIAWFELAAI
jgi:hypothetical protein